ncbi:MAG: threonine ammonia-lyase, biosynthetic, partial [Candidatus Marinamargulisbacteria bacterium]
MNLADMYFKVESADVSGVANVTPLQKAPLLSQRYNNHIYMKREDLQPVFSFKCRGAHNKIRQLSANQKKRGIIAASAGNHAQGVALSAQTLGLNAIIVMPQTTPSIKVDAVKRFGATVILHGDSYDDAYDHAIQTATDNGRVFIHPYDDPDVIAGQGTIAMELLNQLSDPIDYLFVAVGGGGLLAGILAVMKTLSPTTQVIGVEPETSDCLTQALRAGTRVTLPSVGIFADGVAVKQIGELPFNIIQPAVDDTICVSIDAICAAIKDIYDDTRSIVEPAGALSLAGAKAFLLKKTLKNKHVVTINCGANMNFDRLRHVAERTNIGEKKEQLLSVEIPETPGALMAFCETIGRQTITEFNYRYQGASTAAIFLGVETSPDCPNAATYLQSKGYHCQDLSANECAKIHIRHMVGGPPKTPLPNERILRVQFPERPGALLEFLTTLQNAWDITLFHYRNHGAAFGRVLVGFNVPSDTLSDFYASLKETNIYFI